MDLFTIQDFGVEIIGGLILTLIMAILIYIYKKFELQKFGRRIVSSIRLLDFSTKCNLVIFILFISICLIIVISNSYIMNNPAYLKGIAPQFESIPCIYISTYAANGNVIHEFNNDKMKQERYIKLNLRNYGKEDDCNCGLIIAGLCGFDAKGYRNISFYAKGEYGGENFGVKVKDLGNSESGVQANNYIDNKKITKLWSLVDIPLKDFSRVDIHRIECITFYTDGLISGDNLTTIYIKNIEFTN